MNNFVIATAGHIDHGKTTLIKRLTGIETDRTKEEKERGMSINLGFAYWDLPNGERAGIVDVPGHERFVKNMIAGLSGIHLVLLTIDVNEGIMPQTREHLAILQLLNIAHVMIVLTKCSTVDDEWIELVQSEIREELQGTMFEGIPMIRTDALTGEGIDELTQQVMDEMKDSPTVHSTSLTRLNVDRSFSVKGFGTVVTGTLLGKSIHKGDYVYLYPHGDKVRVRNIQVHETDVPQAFSGMRTALNLSGISVEEVPRGSVLSTEERQPTFMLDAKIQVLPQSATPLFHWQRVRILIGTREVMARIVPLGCSEIATAKEGYAQLRLEEAVVCEPHDRFIIRSYSPVTTIAGGEVMEVHPAKHRPHDGTVVDRLSMRSSQNIVMQVDDYCAHQAEGWQTVEQIAHHFSISEEKGRSIVQQLHDEQQLLQQGDTYLHVHQAEGMKQYIGQTLDVFHKKNRLLPGMPPQQWCQLFAADWSPEQRAGFLQWLMAQHEVKQVGNKVARADFVVQYNPHQRKCYDAIQSKLAEQKFMVTALADFDLKNRNFKEVLTATEGELYVRLDEQYIIGQSYFNQALAVVRQLLLEKQQFTLADFRDATQSSRKSSMLILEKMDRLNITKRVENYRVSGKEGIG